MELATERLLLRCPTADDGPAVNVAVRESWAELTQWMEWAQGELPSVEETTARMADRADGFARRDDFTFGIWCHATGQYLGMCSVFNLVWSVPKGEIGYWLRTSATGQGLMTEAVGALTDYALTTLGLLRVEIQCDRLNRRSRKVAERAGFRREGLLRNECRDPQGKLRDTLLFAKTPR